MYANKKPGGPKLKAIWQVNKCLISNCDVIQNLTGQNIKPHEKVTGYKYKFKTP